jgi:outer membrane protein OmpA-like peptidoglycan-associated protein
VNKYDLKPSSQIGLEEVIRLLKENPTLTIQINGHTDNVGSAADNLVLSENRAKAVVNYLKSHGIDGKRLLYKGFGDTQPVSTNDTEEGRAKNRRTELKVLKN